MKRKLSRYYHLTFLFATFAAHISSVSPSCELVDLQLVRDPDTCAKVCKGSGTKPVECKWECTPAPKRYVEVRTCCPGYKNSTITGQCEEIDECEGGDDGKPPCQGACVNVPGSYRCACPSGFQLGSDLYSCQDIDECGSKNHALCRHGKCVNTDGSYMCECPPGRHLSENGTFCQDIDECKLSPHPCPQKCANTDGSYRCECFPGYYASIDGRTCEDINECAISKRCAHVCVNTKGSYRCECPRGYRLSPDGYNCKDINECEEGHPCTPLVGRCTNVPGSFYCSCKPGFALSTDGLTCIDKNECQDGTAKCSHFCENTYGSYTCRTCRIGYHYHNHACIDINECHDGTARCQEFCTNTPGSFLCSCSPGFELASDKTSCQDFNECEFTAKCTHFCENTNGSYNCICPEYLTLSPADNSTCIYAHRSYSEMFNAGTNRILAIAFITIVSVLALAITVRVVHRQCRSRTGIIGTGNSQVGKFFVSQAIHRKKNRKLKKTDETSFGYHLAVPPIDEDINYTPPENGKLI